jgi:hypothetical protein
MPPKATYLLMESRPDIEFDYFLAAKLGRTVAEMRATVSNAEYVGWQVYFGRKAQRQEMAAKDARRR